MEDSKLDNAIRHVAALEEKTAAQASDIAALKAAVAALQQQQQQQPCPSAMLLGLVLSDDEDASPATPAPHRMPFACPSVPSPAPAAGGGPRRRVFCACCASGTDTWTPCKREATTQLPDGRPVCGTHVGNPHTWAVAETPVIRCGFHSDGMLHPCRWPVEVIGSRCHFHAGRM